MVGWKGLSLSQVTLDFTFNDAAQINYDIALVPDTSASPARVMTFHFL
jgi:hypothetical protein